MENYAEMLFIDKVRELQAADGTADKFAAAYPGRTQEALSPHDIEFIEQRVSFYLASVSSTGWPYVQHRGGPQGFLKTLGPSKIGFADYSGNRQYITMGHVARDNRVALILTDYETRSRLKILGRLTMIPVAEATAETVQQLAVQGEGPVERIATIDVEAIDWNCRKYIPQLFAQDRIESLIAENERLKQELQQLRGE